MFGAAISKGLNFVLKAGLMWMLDSGHVQSKSSSCYIVLQWNVRSRYLKYMNISWILFHTIKLAKCGDSAIVHKWAKVWIWDRVPSASTSAPSVVIILLTLSWLLLLYYKKVNERFGDFTLLQTI